MDDLKDNKKLREILGKAGAFLGDITRGLSAKENEYVLNHIKEIIPAMIAIVHLMESDDEQK